MVILTYLWYILGAIGIILIIILILGLPRKKSERVPSIEGINNKEVAEGFEKVAEWLPFKLLRKNIIKQLIKMNPTGSLVDVGCGSGNLIVQIAKKFKSLDLIGVDISLEMIELAKQRVINNKFENSIELKIGTAEKLPFDDSSIDFIVSSLSLHHWTNPVEVIEEFQRVLKKDCRFLIFDFRRDSRRFFYGLLTFATKIVVPKAIKKIKEPLGSLKASYTLDEVKKFLINSNFINLEIKPTLAWMHISAKKGKLII